MFIAERISPTSYIHTAAPFVKEGLAVQQPTETMQAFLKHLTHIQYRFDTQFFREHFIGKLLKNSLDKKLSNLQIMALHILCDEQVRSKLDPTALKEDILPRVCREACKSTDIAVKMKAIYFMALVTRMLDDAYLASNFIPSLKYILENDRTSVVVMCVLGVYRAMTHILSAETLSNAMIPALGPLMADKNLNSSQFEILVHIFYSVTSKLVDFRSADLGISKITPQSTESRSISDAELFSSALTVPQSLVPTTSPSTTSSAGSSGLQLPGSSPLSIPSSNAYSHSSSVKMSDPIPPSYTPAPPTPPSYVPAPPPVAAPILSASVTGSSPVEPFKNVSTLADASTKDNSSKASSSSWFSFSKPKEVETAAYVPPTVPAASQPPVQERNTSQHSVSTVSNTGNSGNSIDLDDFM